VISHLTKAVLVFCLLGTAVGQTQPPLDGSWWLSHDNYDRIQFVAGYIDCYANDLGDKNNTFPESWDTYAPRITNYYEQNQQHRSRSIGSVLFDVRDKYAPKPQSGGETWTEKHWFFDGGYWHDMNRWERLAFIEGYLACDREHLNSRPEHFSKPVPYYEGRISSWFGASAKNRSEMNVKRQHIAIADALYKFADRPGKK
jgi:hypothetical protein